MIKKWTNLLLIIFLMTNGNALFAQDSYWVFFTDKKDVQFNPYEYFDAKAIERRIKNGIPLNDPTDWPLNETYVKAISAIADSVNGQTRWFNALAITASREEIAEIQKFRFVKKIEPMIYYATLSSTNGCDRSIEYSNHRNRQLDILGRADFEKAGFRGKGIRIAIFDAGFPGVDTSPAYASIRNENRLIDTWDFTKNRKNVFYSISHGTEVMSNIGGLIINDDDSIQIGLATEAEFLLAKTEIKREPYSEEKNWLMAVEWADKKGADIINSSLGYTKDRYFRADMDGKKSLVTRAANMAARKGILVVNAIGNDGTNKWLIMGAPADADSVLSVGGIDPKTDYHISFSSYGPTADGRMKPNVCAFGSTVVANPDGYLIEAQGTSFASPLIAGFAACALQANPNMKTMDLFHLIEKSGHLYPYFDYAHGYGIPQAKYVITKKKDAVQKTFDAAYKTDWKPNYIKITIKNLKIDNIGSNDLMYIRFLNAEGRINEYKVIRVSQKKFSIKIYDGSLIKTTAISIYYKGYIQEIKIQK